MPAQNESPFVNKEAAKSLLQSFGFRSARDVRRSVKIALVKWATENDDTEPKYQCAQVDEEFKS